MLLAFVGALMHVCACVCARNMCYMYCVLMRTHICVRVIFSHNGNLNDCKLVHSSECDTSEGRGDLSCSSAAGATCVLVCPCVYLCVHAGARATFLCVCVYIYIYAHVRLSLVHAGNACVYEVVEVTVVNAAGGGRDSNLLSLLLRSQDSDGAERQTFSKVLSIVALYSKYTRTLTFENAACRQTFSKVAPL